jgi:prepilin-type N-terminal cleavage/methylation domain-containing protein
MNKKGFTLVELLAVIVILGIILIIAVPASINISKKVKAKMYSNKIANITKSAVLWGQDNLECLQKNTGTSDSACANVTCTQEGNIKSCKLTVADLAAAGYVDYDNDKIVTNPQTGDAMNNVLVQLKFNTINKAVTVSSILNPSSPSEENKNPTEVSKYKLTISGISNASGTCINNTTNDTVTLSTTISELTVRKNDTINCNITSNTGYNSAMSIDNVQISNNTNFNYEYDTNKTLNINISQSAYSINLISNIGGSLTCKNNKSNNSVTATAETPKSLTIHYNDSYTCTGIANSGYTLNSIQLNSSNIVSGQTYTYTYTASNNITANFKNTTTIVPTISSISFNIYAKGIAKMTINTSSTDPNLTYYFDFGNGKGYYSSSNNYYINCDTTYVKNDIISYKAYIIDSSSNKSLIKIGNYSISTIPDAPASLNWKDACGRSQGSVTS